MTVSHDETILDKEEAHYFHQILNSELILNNWSKIFYIFNEPVILFLFDNMISKLF